MPHMYPPILPLWISHIEKIHIIELEKNLKAQPGEKLQPGKCVWIQQLVRQVLTILNYQIKSVVKLAFPVQLGFKITVIPLLTVFDGVNNSYWLNHMEQTHLYTFHWVDTHLLKPVHDLFYQKVMIIAKINMIFMKMM